MDIGVVIEIAEEETIREAIEIIVKKMKAIAVARAIVEVEAEAMTRREDKKERTHHRIVIDKDLDKTNR
jgi:hypothetical protein